MNRENTRIIRKAFFAEKSQSPETLGRNCITGRTVTESGPTKGIVEDALGPPRFGTELLGRLGIEPLMGITVRRHFVAVCTDGTH